MQPLRYSGFIELALRVARIVNCKQLLPDRKKRSENLSGLQSNYKATGVAIEAAGTNWFECAQKQQPEKCASMRLRAALMLVYADTLVEDTRELSVSVFKHGYVQHALSSARGGDIRSPTPGS
ncbi:hypothetical protein PR003_g6135 [Phytophthora rubi]|uniref:Uncharacterized protein n=1 Tax=Phytophthora rubi TaxID=129364 RepID=A0A6A4FQT1_9STRA|nr:hypothetical protein PR002_g6465 [Phytophthora rubi]KAE9043418.1 hypothetical protein PR001_g5804 [Phytophthora rubi]KAE9348972.1 hypothetical protein PR003_g6135 [Phytophthora rubi]